jgi:hypothetical protein
MAHKIDVYEYIASNNPRGATEILKDFGYRILSNNLSQNLRELVNNEGEDAVVEIMRIHPDRLYFEENNSTIKKFKKATKKLSEASSFSNATGPTNPSSIVNQNHSNQTNTIILASAIVIAFAILSKK